MTQDSNVDFPSESFSISQRYHDGFDRPKKVSSHPVSATFPSFLTLSTNCHTKANRLDIVLRRLSAMELPGKKHVEDYLRHLYRHNCKSSTLSGSLTALQLFLSFIERVGKSQIEQITKQDIEAFVEHEQDRGLKVMSVKTRLSAIYAFLRFLAEGGVVDPKVLFKKIKLRLPEPLPKAMDPDDVRKLLSVLDKPRDRAMILVLLRTGMRIGELLATKVSDVNIEERKIAIYEGEKNRLGRVVHLSNDAIRALRLWLGKRDPAEEILFYGYGSNSLSYAASRHIFLKYLSRAGLSGKSYSLHCLRHYAEFRIMPSCLPVFDKNSHLYWLAP
jgi:integrase/recombinase XerD